MVIYFSLQVDECKPLFMTCKFSLSYIYPYHILTDFRRRVLHFFSALQKGVSATKHVEMYSWNIFKC